MPLLVAAGLVGFTACDGGLLDVDDSGIIVPEDIDQAGAAAVPTLINAVAGTYHEAVDDIVRYAGMLSDEMILSGTFPTRFQVDARRVIANNLSLTTEMYVPLHQARLVADTVVFLFESRIADPEFEDVVGLMNEGITLGKLYGGFSRLWLAELYCWSILTGMASESAPLFPEERIQDALSFLQQAEQLAEQHGLEDVRLASLVGQARAHVWLGDFATAASLAEEVPREFIYWAEYSNNDPDQFNEMYAFTWGDTQSIRWTVGDGTFAGRGNEIWEHFDEFVDLNLIRERPAGFTAFSSTIPVNLQTLYSRPEANVLMASGAEAYLIRAEAHVRAGETGPAEDLINALREDFSTRATIIFNVPPPDPANLLQPIALSGDMEADVKAVADERARELWLTGDRMVTSRRLRLDQTVAIDLFPPVKVAIGGGDDIAFPIVQREIDNNPNWSGDACPSGGPGSWQ